MRPIERPCNAVGRGSFDGRDLAAPGMAAAWNRLVDPQVHADPFGCSHVWQFANKELIPATCASHVRMEGDSAIAFSGATSGSTMRLRPWDLGFASCPLLGEKPVEMLADLLARKPTGVDDVEIMVTGIRRRSRLEKALRTGLGSAARISVSDERKLRVASLEGGLDGYLSRRSSHMRKNLRRESRRGAEAGIRLQRVRSSTPSGIRTNFARMLGVEDRSWKRKCASSYSLASTGNLYRTLLETMARSRDVRIIFAIHRGRDVGFILGGVFNDLFSGMHFSFDRDAGHLSIGNLMQLGMIEWLCADGILRYDMGIAGGGRLAYKERWAEIGIEARNFKIEVGLPVRRSHHRHPVPRCRSTEPGAR